METRHFTIYAGYHQFYLSRDEESLVGSGGESFWTVESIRSLLAAGPGLLGIGTATFGHVPVSVEISRKAPEAETTGWDHVTEASIDLRTGRLYLAGCPSGSAGSISVIPGVYRVRIHSASLGAADGEMGHDHYRIVLWPEPLSPPRILKQWAPALRFCRFSEDSPDSPHPDSRVLYSH
jgi:hypothetical protein